jgi:hypothetical protein
MPKTKHNQYGQKKTDLLRARLTPDGKRGLERLAEQHGVSVGELLERVGRGQLSPLLLSGESCAN